jgi:hypothetical protein
MIARSVRQTDILDRRTDQLYEAMCCLPHVSELDQPILPA